MIVVKEGCELANLVEEVEAFMESKGISIEGDFLRIVYKGKSYIIKDSETHEYGCSVPRMFDSERLVIKQ